MMEDKDVETEKASGNLRRNIRGVIMNKRDSWRYELRHGHEIVYIGITNDPERRETEHKSERKRFTNMNIVGPSVTRKTAEKWEEERLRTYRRNHRKKSPKYNKTDR
ncbi:MAG: GIY-YIG nuclease family protein [Theionarchaea archaeon]|nr:GIY-YIG nuclease family protein [Theionarchaea archaeon]